MKRYTTLVIFLLCLVLTGLATAAQTSGRWESLGQREVDFRNDHDQIDVGRNEGKFRQLQIRVKDAPIEITNMVVRFGNDQTFSPKLRYKFAEGSGTQVIDLPGERRTIKRIDFNYRSISRREGKGTIAVFGR